MMVQGICARQTFYPDWRMTLLFMEQFFVVKFSSLSKPVPLIFKRLVLKWRNLHENINLCAKWCLFLGVNVSLSWPPFYFFFFFFVFRSEKAALKAVNQVMTIGDSFNKKLDSILFPFYLVSISTCIACV